MYGAVQHFEQNTGTFCSKPFPLKWEGRVDGKENAKRKHVSSDTVYTSDSGEVLGDGTRRTTRAARV